MSGRTFSTYIAWRFLSAILAVFAACVVLVFLVDVIELMRRASDKPNYTAGLVALLALYRVPHLTEQIFPFASLFGGIFTLIVMSRRLELVVARAAGSSAFQFLFPCMIVAFATGLFAILVFNPVSAELKERSNAIEAHIFGEKVRSLNSDDYGSWIRQGSADGEAIIHARSTLDEGTVLLGVTVYTYDDNGRFAERIDAERAEISGDHWRLTNATVTLPNQAPATYASYLLSSKLTSEQVRERLADPDSVAFWTLPHLIRQTDLAGLPSDRYRLQYNALLAKPLLMAAMVLIAAVVSLRVGRFGGIGRLVLGGITAGFVLYVANELAEDLGGVGLVPPVVAAWTPTLVAVLMGTTVLLYQEDG